MLVRRFDHFLVTDRPAGLDDGRDPGAGGLLEAIGEGEEAVGSEDGPFRLMTRFPGLVDKGAVLASDGFFPFADGLEEAARAGITAIIQPGGSVRDQEVIEAANKHGMAMVMTGARMFRH